MKEFSSIFHEKSIYDNTEPEHKAPRFGDMIDKINSFCSKAENDNYDKKYAAQAKTMLNSAKNRFEAVSKHSNSSEINKAKSALSRLAKVESKCRLSGTADKLGGSLGKVADKVIEAGKKSKNESSLLFDFDLL